MNVRTFFEARWDTARKVFLLAALIVVVYAALKHWNILERTVWNIPGFAMLLGSMPWSLAWLELPLSARKTVLPGFRLAFDLAAMAIGFGFNCAALYLAASAIATRGRLTTQSNGRAANAPRADDCGRYTAELERAA